MPVRLSHLNLFTLESRLEIPAPMPRPVAGLADRSHHDPVPVAYVPTTVHRRAGDVWILLACVAVCLLFTFALLDSVVFGPCSPIRSSENRNTNDSHPTNKAAVCGTVCCISLLQWPGFAGLALRPSVHRPPAMHSRRQPTALAPSPSPESEKRAHDRPP